MRVEQEQRVTEDARRFAEQDAAAQRYAAQVLQVAFGLIYRQFLHRYFSYRLCDMVCFYIKVSVH